MSDRPSVHLSDDVIREYEVLELPNLEVPSHENHLPADLNTVREATNESFTSTNTAIQTFDQIVIREEGPLSVQAKD